jgi:hypothetical protein
VGMPTTALITPYTASRCSRAAAAACLPSAAAAAAASSCAPAAAPPPRAASALGEPGTDARPPGALAWPPLRLCWSSKGVERPRPASKPRYGPPPAAPAAPPPPAPSESCRATPLPPPPPSPAPGAGASKDARRLAWPPPWGVAGAALLLGWCTCRKAECPATKLPIPSTRLRDRPAASPASPTAAMSPCASRVDHVCVCVCV